MKPSLSAARQRQPKPMTKDEFEKCLKVIGWPEDILRRRVGIKRMPGRQKIRPANFTLQQTRCIRWLALKPKWRKYVEDLAEKFPGVTLESVRPFRPDAKD